MSKSGSMCRMLGLLMSNIWWLAATACSAKSIFDAQNSIAVIWINQYMDMDKLHAPRKLWVIAEVHPTSCGRIPDPGQSVMTATDLCSEYRFWSVSDNRATDSSSESVSWLVFGQGSSGLLVGFRILIRLWPVDIKFQSWWCSIHRFSDNLPIYTDQVMKRDTNQQLVYSFL